MTMLQIRYNSKNMGQKIKHFLPITLEQWSSVQPSLWRDVSYSCLCLSGCYLLDRNWQTGACDPLIKITKFFYAEMIKSLQSLFGRSLFLQHSIIFFRPKATHPVKKLAYISYHQLRQNVFFFPFACVCDWSPSMRGVRRLWAACCNHFLRWGRLRWGHALAPLQNHVRPRA